MIDQLTFDSVTPDVSPEIRVYHDILRHFLPILDKNVIDKRALEFRESTAKNKTYSTVLFADSIICRLRMQGSEHYISVPIEFKKFIPSEYQTKIVKADPQYIRIIIHQSFDISSLMPALSTVLNAKIDHLPKLFDCCHLYMQCSDAGVCVQTDNIYSLNCGYRKVLKNGRCFFGVNRTEA